MARPKPRKASSLNAAEWRQLTDGTMRSAKALLALTPPQAHDALYLAGFALETALKGKTLMEGIPPLETHDLTELMYCAQIYRKLKADPVPSAVNARIGSGPYPKYEDLFDFLVKNWDNEKRYSVTGTSISDATEFVTAVEEMVAWIWTA